MSTEEDDSDALEEWLTNRSIFPRVTRPLRVYAWFDPSEHGIGEATHRRLLHAAFDACRDFRHYSFSHSITLREWVERAHYPMTNIEHEE